MDSTSSTDDMYLYHIPTRSWTKGDSGTSHVSTNFAIDKDQELIVLDKGAGNTTSALIRKWNTTSQNQTITLTTKDIDFGNPATKKHVRKVSLSYKCASGDRPTVNFDVNGNSDLDKTFSTSLSTQSDFSTVELKPNTPFQARNINSFQVKLSGPTDSNFILSDISIIYREKSPR